VPVKAVLEVSPERNLAELELEEEEDPVTVTSGGPTSPTTTGRDKVGEGTILSLSRPFKCALFSATLTSLSCFC